MVLTPNNYILRIGKFICILIILFMFHQSIEAEDQLDRLMKACSEGDKKACEVIDRIVEEHKSEIDRFNAQADLFQADAKKLGLQNGYEPNLEKAYPIILKRYLSSNAVDPVHKKKGINKQLLPACAKSFNDLFFVYGKKIPRLSSGEPDWAIIYTQTVEHYFRYCSKKAGY